MEREFPPLDGPTQYIRARELTRTNGNPDEMDWADRFALAQVHATLALVGAIIELNRTYAVAMGGMAYPSVGWDEAVGV